MPDERANSPRSALSVLVEPTGSANTSSPAIVFRAGALAVSSTHLTAYGRSYPLTACDAAKPWEPLLSRGVVYTYLVIVGLDFAVFLFGWAAVGRITISIPHPNLGGELILSMSWGHMIPRILERYLFWWGVPALVLGYLLRGRGVALSRGNRVIFRVGLKRPDRRHIDAVMAAVNSLIPNADQGWQENPQKSGAANATAPDAGSGALKGTEITTSPPTLSQPSLLLPDEPVPPLPRRGVADEGGGSTAGATPTPVAPASARDRPIAPTPQTQAAPPEIPPHQPSEQGAGNLVANLLQRRLVWAALGAICTVAAWTIIGAVTRPHPPALSEEQERAMKQLADQVAREAIARERQEHAKDQVQFDRARRSASKKFRVLIERWYSADLTNFGRSGRVADAEWEAAARLVRSVAEVADSLDFVELDVISGWMGLSFGNQREQFKRLAAALEQKDLASTRPIVALIEAFFDWLEDNADLDVVRWHVATCRRARPNSR
jgi:hypothetical protein